MVISVENPTSQLGSLSPLCGQQCARQVKRGHSHCPCARFGVLFGDTFCVSKKKNHNMFVNLSKMSLVLPREGWLTVLSGQAILPWV